ncbi:MAG: hypothetical protein IT385_21030 [Deltaproteobacteria bacterium]|nr:hypothetical protein [Deltaproteobacteria bacterium]
MAPAGFGKSTLLEQVGGALVRVPVGATEGHAGLLADVTAQRLKRAFPGALGAVRLAQTLGGPRGGESPSAIVRKIVEQLPPGTALTLAFDEVDQLPPRSEGLEIVQGLASNRPDGVRLILAGRPPMAIVVGGEATVIGHDALAFDASEIEALVQATLGESRPALAADVMRDTLGWPALVAARLELGAREPMPDALVRAFGPTIDQVVQPLRGDVRFLAQVAAASGRADPPMLQALASGDVPGSPEARRRLVRLDPAAAARARDELERLGLIVATAAGPMLHPAALRVLRERFRQADHAGYLEAHRRAGELLLQGTPEPTAEIVELFATAEERERVADLLQRHGPRLELELATSGEDERLLRWVEGLEPGWSVVPFWADALAGVVGVRSRDPVVAERGRERLERARTSLASEKREVVLGRWQPRLAEGQALAARAKGAYAEARSWFTRGLDQLAQTRKRGLVPAGEVAEAAALELRMQFELFRLSRLSSTWDKTRDPALQALATFNRKGTPADPRCPELRAALIAGALSAADRQVLTALSEGDTVIAACARAARRALDEGGIEPALAEARAAWQAARQSSERALAGVLVGRLAPSPEGAHVLGIVAGLTAGRQTPDPAVAPFALEAELRLGRPPSEPIPGEGWLGALQIEMAAREAEVGKRVRALEGARDAWRRAGARWEEMRLFLELASLGERRLADNEAEGRDILVRAFDGAVDLAQAAVGRDAVALPWQAMGDARRVEATLRAGYRYGSERVRVVCRAELERRGADVKSLVTEPKARPQVPGAAPSQAAIGQAKKIALASGASFVATGRSSVQAMNDGELAALLEAKATSLFIVLVPERVVVNFGKRISLGQKRIMLPLLIELLRHPDEAFSMLELARRVWDAQTELTPTIVTKVKVAISRLRALLGRNRAYINTTRKDEGGESVVAYQVAPQLQFLIVEGARE